MPLEKLVACCYSVVTPTLLERKYHEHLYKNGNNADRHDRSFYDDEYLGPADYLNMLTFILWLILLCLCWPLALLAVLLYPIIWLVLLPFKLLGIAVGGVFELLRAVIMLPARIVRGR